MWGRSTLMGAVAAVEEPPVPGVGAVRVAAVGASKLITTYGPCTCTEKGLGINCGYVLFLRVAGEHEKEEHFEEQRNLGQAINRPFCKRANTVGNFSLHFFSIFTLRRRRKKRSYLDKLIHSSDTAARAR